MGELNSPISENDIVVVADEPASAMEIPAFLPDTSDAVEIQEFLPEEPKSDFPSFPNPFRHPLRAIGWSVRAGFGIASLILLLAVIAAIPIVNFLALGYLLEIEGRVARTGKLRMAFPLLESAPKLGMIALGLIVWLIPLRLAAGYAADARLIDPTSAASIGWNRIVPLAAVLVAVHLCFALARGGSLGCFFRPIKNVRWLIRRLRKGDYWDRAAENLREFVTGLQLRHHFSLGLRGFLGALAWLAIPTALFAAANKTEGGPILLTLFGGLCLVVVFTWLPFLQARFAAENRLRSFLELRAITDMFARTPIVWSMAVVSMFVLALPLYLLKVRLLPQDAMWFITIVFIVGSFPARVIVGWAYHRATKKTKAGWFEISWFCRTVMFLALAAYTFMLFLTPAISEHGKWVLIENHAFLLPVPF